MSSQNVSTAPCRPAHALGFNIAGIAVLVLMMAVGAAYLIDELGRSNRVPLPTLGDGEPIVQTLSGRALSIPTAWFRYGEQIKDGFTSQIDLRVMFAPPQGDLLPVDISLLPRSRARTSASVLDSVYLHQFSDDSVGGIPGLVGKPMVSGSGFAGETVWYDPLSPAPFVAKCQDALTPDGRPQCVRTVYLASGIAAIYTFDAAALPGWRNFDTAMQQWLEPIGAW